MLVAGFVGLDLRARPARASGGIVALAVPLAAVVTAVALVLGGQAGGRAFAATAVAIGGVIAALFANLYPNLLISTTDAANTLTVANSTASPYSLQVMTIVAAVMVPLVLLYQGWTYYVFRAGSSARPPPTRPRGSTSAARLNSLTRHTVTSRADPRRRVDPREPSVIRPRAGQACAARPPTAGRPSTWPSVTGRPRRAGW